MLSLGLENVPLGLVADGEHNILSLLSATNLQEQFPGLVVVTCQEQGNILGN